VLTDAGFNAEIAENARISLEINATATALSNA
jgi:hypothetical protein